MFYFKTLKKRKEKKEKLQFKKNVIFAKHNYLPLTVAIPTVAVGVAPRSVTLRDAFRGGEFPVKHFRDCQACKYITQGGIIYLKLSPSCPVLTA